MILRKPYAFLIKNFKRIHFVISLFMGYLIYKSLTMLEYINRYISDGWLTNSNIEISDYMTVWTFVIVIFTMLLLGIIFVLLKNKKKPALFYVASILMLIGTVIVYLVVLGDLNVVLIDIVDQRKIRITRDLVMMISIMQIINVIFCFIRATGFNIRKFDFEHDLKDLDITAKDYEEIELTLKIDTNEIRRQLRKRKRKFRYFVLENLVAFVILIVILSVSIGVYIVLNIMIYEKTYVHGEEFRTTDGILTINNSYYTNTDYNGNDIGKSNYSYLVVNFSVENIYTKEKEIDINNFVIFIDDKGYNPISNKYLSMRDFGEGYSNQIIESGNIETFIVVFEVPKNITYEKLLLKYVDYYSVVKVYELETKYKDVEISPIYVENEKIEKSYVIGDELLFDDSALNNISLTINNYDTNIRFDDGGLIRADTMDDYDKTLLMLETEYNGDINFSDLIDDYLTIKYKIDDKYITHRIPIKDKTAVNSKNIYLEVLKEIENASKIDLVFETRECTYIYNLKSE